MESSATSAIAIAVSITLIMKKKDRELYAPVWNGTRMLSDQKLAKALLVMEGDILKAAIVNVLAALRTIVNVMR